MAPLELVVKICSAKDLKNVNWRHGNLKPYAVVWVDPTAKCTTKVAEDGDTCPYWDEKWTIPLRDRPVEDATLYIDIVHAETHEDTKPLIGSSRVPLAEIVNEVGIGEKCFRSLKLKRPSGRPQGKLDVEVQVLEHGYYAPPPIGYAAPYGQSASRDYAAPYSYGTPYAAAPPAGYPYDRSPYGQPAAYGQPAPHGQPAAYGQPLYGQPAYAADPYAAETTPQKSSKYGMGTGLAVGAVAGVLGGLALAEGVDYVEDKIADEAAEKVEDDLVYGDGGYDGDD